MEPVVVYGCTVLVLWATSFMPDAIRRRRWRAIAISYPVVFGPYAALAWHNAPGPRSILATVVILGLATGGAFAQARHETRKAERAAAESGPRTYRERA